jgi:NAD(P)-dependent dehydrogenase (short-subunit alcohol dehydrogenase family)
MKVDLRGRVALITGAAQGIGKAIAVAFAQNGATVAVNDIRPAGAESVRELTRGGGKAKFYRADVSDVNAVNRMVAKLEKELGPIDILVNNAGINLGRKRYPVHEFPDGDWHRIVRVDLDGVFYCSRAVSGRMVKRKRGVIINIGSIAGVVPLRVQSAFDAVKAGVHNFTRCHALEVGPHGIRVNAIAPGSIVTAGTKRLFYSPARRKLAKSLLSHVPLGRPGEVEEIAAAALYLASDDAAYVTGHVLVVDGGWTAGFTRDW